MLLVIGILSALFERSRSWAGQVDVPRNNILDLGSPFYNVYETAEEVLKRWTRRSEYHRE